MDFQGQITRLIITVKHQKIFSDARLVCPRYVYIKSIFVDNKSMYIEYTVMAIISFGMFEEVMHIVALREICRPQLYGSIE